MLNPEGLDAVESVSWYLHGEHLSMLEDYDSTYCESVGICTLGTWVIDAIWEASSDGYVDSTIDAYNLGNNTFVFSVQIDSISGDTTYIDSLWWDITSTSGLGPFVNADGSSVVIGPNIAEDTFYGPFAIQDEHEHRNYPLKIPRGQGILTIMAHWASVDSGSIRSELWRGRR